MTAVKNIYNLKTIRWQFITLFIVSFPFACSYALADTGLINRIQETEKSIVSVQTELSRNLHSNPPLKATFTRSALGLILDSSGIIVANTHTIIHAPFIFVTLKDGTRLRARVIYTSKHDDFCFLKIHPPYPLPTISWANSALVKLGKPIIAIRNAQNHHPSILTGHIKNILLNHRGSSGDFLELDLDLHHGDSGGPILDEHGRLLGMIMARRESLPNSSIAIASNKIHRQYLQYINNVR